MTATKHHLTTSTAVAALLASAALVVQALPSTEGLQPMVRNGFGVACGDVDVDEEATIWRMAGAFPARIVIRGHGGDFVVAPDFQLHSRDEPLMASGGLEVLADQLSDGSAVQGVFDGDLQPRALTLRVVGTTAHRVPLSHLD